MNSSQLLHNEIDFPLIIELNFDKLFDEIKVSDHKTYDEFMEDPVFAPLRKGLLTYDEIEQNRTQIESLMQTVFPYPLRKNEIKTGMIPFTNIFFYKSERFAKIIEAAGEDYVLETRNMDTDNAYIFACSLILAFHHGFQIDFKRPFFYDIPNETGRVSNYRVVLNGDFIGIEATEAAVPITEEDVALLIDNYHNVDLWKEKFPPNSYHFKGFGIANMFDMTIDEALSNLKTNLIKRDETSFKNIEENIRSLFGKENLVLGLTPFDQSTQAFSALPDPNVRSLLLGNLETCDCAGILCDQLMDEIFEEKATVAISDIEKYGEGSGHNDFYKTIKEQGFASYLVAPLVSNGVVTGVIELGSPDKYFLNSINAGKLDDVTPIFSIVLTQALEGHKNMLEVIIQEECTSIHPSVAWKFEEEAERFYRAKLRHEDPTFKEIVFEDVYPLFGQCDIRGSSDMRNAAIRADLQTQLNAAEKVIQAAHHKTKLPIYEELIYRMKQFDAELSDELAAGAERQILDFLKSDVYPVFEHLQRSNKELSYSVQEYKDLLDDNLGMVYHERKQYDTTVMQINKNLSTYLDFRAAEAQQMFPHFFERYKTDGVEYNIYIGQSIVKDKRFDSIYLNNLKLWQLTTMCELENQFELIKPLLSTKLEVASLILAYSTPLSIRFRMDEKQFDVDGAYNARYEIVKKRIDKSYIKGTTERLTQPGMLSIVYTQQSERLEYDKYAEYLKALGYITGEVEYHILEDLQGVTGLRAMRYHINYDRDQFEKKLNAEQKRPVFIGG